MAILQKLKSLLGLGDSRSEQRHDRDVGVTVERESGRSGDEVAEPDEVDADERTPAPSSPTGATDAMVEPTDEPEEAAEPAEATGPSENDAAPTAEKAGDPVPTEPEAEVETESESAPEAPSEPEVEAEPETEAEPEAETEPETEAEPEAETEAPSEPVDEIKGIGPAYADRLGDAGVETVADLAAADAEELASETDISEKRIGGWIERARVR